MSVVTIEMRRATKDVLQAIHQLKESGAKTTRSNIAETAKVCDRTVSRALHELTALGVVKVKNRGIYGNEIKVL